MAALRMMLGNDVQESVEFCEKEVKTYEEIRVVVMKWSISCKIESKRCQRDPMN